MKTRRGWLAVIIIGLVWVTLACENSTATPGAYSAPLGAAPVVTSPAHQSTVEALQVERYRRAIEAETVLEQFHAEATATAVAHAAQVWAVTATADAHYMQATATAQAQQAHATATTWAIEPETQRAQATATAIAQATAEARAAAAWAATMTAEAVHFHATAEAERLALHATATAIAQQATLEAAQVEAQRQAIELESRRAAAVYPLQAYGPWVLLALLVVLLCYAIWRIITVAELRARAIPRDARGDAPFMVLQQGRRMIVYDGDKSFGPAAVIDAESVTMPPLADETQQAAVTMRDQAVDLATRGLPQVTARPAATPRQRQAAQRLAMTGAPPSVKVIEAVQVGTWLRDVTPQALALSLESEVEL